MRVRYCETFGMDRWEGAEAGKREAARDFGREEVEG